MPDSSADVNPTPGVLEDLQREVMKYFDQECNPANGLVSDSTRDGSHCSISAVGLGIAARCCSANAGRTGRAEACGDVLTTLRTFADLPQSDGSEVGGYRGFFYHFLHMETGLRAGESELSSIDTAVLIAGALVAKQYFDGGGADEAEVRRLADHLYRNVEWDWMMDGGPTPRMGWKPEGGFMPPRWEGYSEGLLLMLLGLGSPTHPLPAESYAAFCSTYKWVEQFGHEHVRAGPLFIHQLPHCFVDFRGIADAFMRPRGLDYFENSRLATLVQQAHAKLNPDDWVGYGEHCWGLTASNGPGPAEREVRGKPRTFFDYTARGVSGGGKADPDDGTLAPWAVAASLPFAPEAVLPTLAHMQSLGVGKSCRYGFESTFNQTFKDEDSPTGFWLSPDTFGLDQGPIVLMVENFQNGLIWHLMRQCDYLRHGLLRAGFTGGWLG